MAADDRNVRILFGEPEGSLRSAIRAALNREGYNGVTDYDRMDALKEAVVSESPDLIVTDADMDTGNADALIEDIRHNRAGKNPFVPIIVTLWEPTREMVQRIAAAGPDDMLVKPLSPAQVFDRIKALVNNRKPFVVTSDYIGPDRRKDVVRGSEIPTFEVPNTLRSKVKGEPLNQSAVDSAVAAAQHEINDQRLKRNAFQLCFLINLLLPELQKFEVTDDRIKTVEKLMSVSRDTGNRMKGTEYEHVTSLCTAMIRVASSIHDSISHPEAKDISLLKPMSDAIMAAFHPGESSEDFAAQISSAITTYKSRNKD